MPVTFELHLEERLPDRVIVSVHLAPRRPGARVDGVALELFSRKRESLSPRVVLPITGDLIGEIVVRAEIRANDGPLPPGVTVIGTAWWDTDQVRAVCPADPWTELEAHMRGRRCVKTRGFADEDWLTSLEVPERRRLAALFPWIDHPRDPCQTYEHEPLDALDVVDEISEELGLDEANTAWLRELLDEDDR